MDLFRSFFERQPELSTAATIPEAPAKSDEPSVISDEEGPSAFQPPPIDTDSALQTLKELAFRDGKSAARLVYQDSSSDAPFDPEAQQSQLDAHYAVEERHMDTSFLDYDIHKPFPLSQLQADYPMVTPAKRAASQSASPAPHTDASQSASRQKTHDEPIPISHPSSPENVSLMYQLCTNRCVRPELYFSQVIDLVTWACRLTLHLPVSVADAAGIPVLESPNSAGLKREIWETINEDQRTWTVTVQDRNPYPSKKVAKEHVAEMAIPILRLLPAPSKQTASDSAEPEANWIGRLLEFCNATGIPQASYQEFKAGQGFACELSMQTRPHFVFGGRDKTFPNKKSAKAAAAREAVLWLRDTGRLAEVENRRSKRSQKNRAEMQDSKRQKMAVSPPAQPQVRNIGPVMQAILSSASPTGSEPQSRPQSPLMTTTIRDGQQDRSSYTKKVLALCAELRMQPPSYRTRPNPDAPSLFSVTATFTGAADLDSLRKFRILTPGQTGVGVTDVKVRGVALEACAQCVYDILLELQRCQRAVGTVGLRITGKDAAAASELVAATAQPAMDAVIKAAVSSPSLATANASKGMTTGQRAPTVTSVA